MQGCMRLAFFVLEVGYVFLLTINGIRVINVSLHDSQDLHFWILNVRLNRFNTRYVLIMMT